MSIKKTHPYSTQLEFDFSILSNGRKVIATGYDVYNLRDMSRQTGVIDGYLRQYGYYSVYFKNFPGLFGAKHLILYYCREQLQPIPGAKGRCSWQSAVEREIKKSRKPK